jgi:hypothetical protein
MKLVRTLSIALVMAFSITAAADDKKPAPAPAPAKDAPAPAPSADAPAKADVEKWMAFFDKLVDIVVADKDACPKMATDVGAHIDANADLLAKAQAAQDKGQKLPKDAEEHMQKSMQKMMGGMQKCGNDKAVQAAFAKMMTKKKTK